MSVYRHHSIIRMEHQSISPLHRLFFSLYTLCKQANSLCLVFWARFTPKIQFTISFVGRYLKVIAANSSMLTVGNSGEIFLTIFHKLHPQIPAPTILPKCEEVDVVVLWCVVTTPNNTIPWHLARKGGNSCEESMPLNCCCYFSHDFNSTHDAMSCCVTSGRSIMCGR